MAGISDLLRQENIRSDPYFLVGINDWYVLTFRVTFYKCNWSRILLVNMLVHLRYCQSGVASTNYAEVCKVTDISAPVLSILVNVSVMVLTLWQAWYVNIFCDCGGHINYSAAGRTLRDILLNVMHNKKKNKIFALFVLLVESGTLYVVMLVSLIVCILTTY